jgi:hypothetical protein
MLIMWVCDVVSETFYGEVADFGRTQRQRVDGGGEEGTRVKN